MNPERSLAALGDDDLRNFHRAAKPDNTEHAARQAEWRKHVESEIKKIDLLPQKSKPELPADPLDRKNLEISFARSVDSIMQSILGEDELNIHNAAVYGKIVDLLQSNKDSIIEMAVSRFGTEAKPINEAMIETIKGIIRAQENNK